MNAEQIKLLGRITGDKISSASEQLRHDIDLQRKELEQQNDQTREQLRDELDKLDSSLSERLDEATEKQALCHALEIESLTEQIKAQEVFEAQLTQRIAEIKDGEQGFQGERGADGIDRPLLEPVELTDKDYPKNTLGTHDGGLWISTKQSVGSPESDPHAWSCILDAMTTMAVDLEDDGQYKLTVRMSTGSVIEDRFSIPFPEHKGIWEAGDYQKGQIVTKGHSFWQAMKDTSGEPPGNGWKQVLTAPKGKVGPAGKDGEKGDQGKPGRNGIDAKLPENLVNDLMSVASARKAFEDGREDAYAVTSYRGYFMSGEAYRSGDLVNALDSLFLCTSSGTYSSIADSNGAFQQVYTSPSRGGTNGMVWMGEWEAGRTYSTNATVRDGAWTMVALRQTDERAAIHPIGDSHYLFDGTLAGQTATAKQVMFGTRYTAEQDAYINHIRMDVTTGQSYKVYIVTDPGPDETYTLIADLTASTTGWRNFNTGKHVIRHGLTFDVIAACSKLDPAPVEWTGDWDYDTPNNPADALPGQVVQANNAVNQMRFNKLDDAGADRGTELLALAAGDHISGVGIVWTIQAVTDEGDQVYITVLPALQGSPDGVTTFTFSAQAADSISYGRDDDYYLTNVDVSGLYVEDDAYENIVVNENAYGIDIDVQPAYVPTDWDVVAVADLGATTEVSVFTPTETAWVQSSASPFRVGGTVTNSGDWHELGRETIPDGMKGKISVDAKRLDAVGWYASELSAMAYIDGGTLITDYSLITELGENLDVRIVADGLDLVVEVKGKNGQDWSWDLVAYYVEVEA